MAPTPVLKPRGFACPSSHSISICIVTLFLLVIPSAHSQSNSLYLDTTDLSLLVGQTQMLNLIQNGEFNTTLEVEANIQHADIVQLVPSTFEIPGSKDPNSSGLITYELCAYGKNPGHTDVTFKVTPSGFINIDNVFLRIKVMHSDIIYVISYIIGWIYFAAWSFSFYPQIYTNYKRKSVVGLNFDFLALNLLGFLLYSLFNCGLYFSPGIQAEYFERFPRGHIPVQLNDVFFSLHALFATIVTITQCLVYERENQRVSIIGRLIILVFIIVIIVSAGFSIATKLKWLDFLYYCSYIKLSITLIKYIPQAYMNYKRKSTVGWSIGNIMLDFLGGFLSILQMMLNAYNYDDWDSFFGDATKFGLGLFSLIFDIFFILQHYVFYRKGKDFMMVNSSDEISDMSSSGEGRRMFLLVDHWNADEKKYDLNGKV